MTETIAIAVIITFAFIAGYALREYTAQKEMARIDPILTTHIGMTAQRLNYKPEAPTARDYAKPQNSINHPLGESIARTNEPKPSTDLFRRRQEAVLTDYKKQQAKEQGWNAMPPMRD